jgi:hypothetical protein
VKYLKKCTLMIATLRFMLVSTGYAYINVQCGRVLIVKIICV